MINYMLDLMEDVTDFNWQNAKAAHAVLCCEFQRGTVSWEDTDRIYHHIRRAQIQRVGLKQRTPENLGFVVFIKTVRVSIPRTMRLQVKCTDTSAGIVEYLSCTSQTLSE